MILISTQHLTKVIHIKTQYTHFQQEKKHTFVFSEINIFNVKLFFHKKKK